tara:strand:- start:595 stop:1140 length:546 start_codon:yes stop_codon:yes gene_type:complete
MSTSSRDYAGIVADAETLSHPEHRSLFSQWTENRRGPDVPLRSTFDPLAFHRYMPRMAIIERTGSEGNETFRYRLAGTEIAQRAGRDPTGKTFEELYQGTYLETAKQTYLEIAETRQCHFSQRVFPIGDGGSALRYDRIILPYSSDGAAVDQFVLLIVVVAQDTPKKQVGSFSFFSGTKDT